MSQPLSPGSAYIVAARRSALGRPGGLHRTRRIEALSAPIIEAVLKDAGVPAAQVHEFILGNTTAGGNPARVVALAAGLDESVPALTVDRQCASGLDAILLGLRTVMMGEAAIVIAGGAESLSTAPWRIAKPRTLFQTPRFIGPEGDADGDHGFAFPSIAACEMLARRRGISRSEQDMETLKAHLKADKARDDRRFVGEIVPIRGNAEEARDETGAVPEIDDLAELDPLVPPDGTHTSGNSASPRDGAAMVLIVSPSVYADLGRPPALRLLACATQGVGAGEEAAAPILALEKAMRPNGAAKPAPQIVETSEASAAQVLALAQALELGEASINPAGGAIVRGYPLGASGAVSLVRLFSELVRRREETRASFGAVTQGAAGGLGVAALFERV
ncbi:MAG: thiolase family protein [Hyphomicrobiaceae bacterium]|nr:thiolase family protein [Hyphomicrobiaceae bacterium]